MIQAHMEHVLQPTPGWFRGDFHTHTLHSDGSQASLDLVRMAVERGLDFVSITDHNTLDAFEDLPLRPDILVLPGLEVTLTVGHYNILGIDGWRKWLDPLRLEEIAPGQMTAALRRTTPEELMARAESAGAINSINHPLLRPWEWQAVDLPLATFTCLEIWNDPTFPDNAAANPESVDLWTRWLNAGHRHTAIGGSDYHGPERAEGNYEPAVGSPSTWVYAPALSAAGLLDGLRRRRAYMTMGPTISLTATHDGYSVFMGDDLGPASGLLHLSIQIDGLPEGGVIQHVRRGEVAGEWGDTSIQVTIPLKEDLVNDWFRVDVRDGDGRLVAVTNPIFAGMHSQPAGETFGDYHRWE